MNTIVQALIHTPVLRDYFLADRHLCQLTKEGDKQCLVCELSRIFQEVRPGTEDIKLFYVHLNNMGECF